MLFSHAKTHNYYSVKLQLTANDTCFKIRTIKVEAINDIKDAKVSVYQYYSPGMNLKGQTALTIYLTVTECFET